MSTITERIHPYTLAAEPLQTVPGHCDVCGHHGHLRVDDLVCASCELAGAVFAARWARDLFAAGTEHVGRVIGGNW